MLDTYNINKTCIIKIPNCGYGFNSQKMCFVALPSDDEFTMEYQILEKILKERNYDTYAALENIDSGSFAFCTKICSKIITSHFCIVLLNESSHKNDENIKIPNPNVQFEYGMMLSFHKHVIPMQLESESLPFNISPLDTVKYTKKNFMDKATAAIDEMIDKLNISEGSSISLGMTQNIVNYLQLEGFQISGTDFEPNSTFYKIGVFSEYNLFSSLSRIRYAGYFTKFDAKEIIVKIKTLVDSLNGMYEEINMISPVDTIFGNQREVYLKLLKTIDVVIIVSDEVNSAAINQHIEKLKCEYIRPKVKVIPEEEISKYFDSEYNNIDV